VSRPALIGRALALAVLYAAIVAGVVIFGQAGAPFIYQGF